MTALAPILPKLDKLLPRLASDRDGEVIATARAIGRALAGAGLDWHDLAAALRLPVAREPQPGPAPRTPELRAMADFCILRGPGALTDKELSFVLNVAVMLKRGRAPSEKQAAWLRAIHDRLRGGEP